MRKFFEFIKKNKKILIEVVALILITFFSFSVAPKTLQNDTFYTVSIGNLIMENGIDMKDHFSWHEDLPYTYPHWLYDVFMSIIYNLGNWDGVYILVCIMSIMLGLSIYIVNKKLNKNQVISFAVTIGAMYLLKDYIAARAQLATFIIYVWVIFFMEKFLENPKKIGYGLAIILSSILIANLHVAVWPFIFVLSLPYIAEYIIALLADVVIYQKLLILYDKIALKLNKKNPEKIKEIEKELEEVEASNLRRKAFRESQEPYKIKMSRNKNTKWLILVMVICAFTGFLTPLGTTPYTYLITTMQGDTVKKINEHLPLTLINNIPIMCTIIVILSLLIFTKVKIRLSDLFMIGGLCYLMLSTRRQLSMFALIGSVILTRLIVDLIKRYTKNGLEEVEFAFKNIFVIFALIVLMIFTAYHYIKPKIGAEYVNSSSYPVAACDYILENIDLKNARFYNEYNYGSYMLFRGIPVFIDSRADLYAPEFSGNKNEDIFTDFINTSGISKFYEDTFEKYNITHVIMYKKSKMNLIITKTKDKNYKELYSDDNFVIYERLNVNE